MKFFALLSSLVVSTTAFAGGGTSQGGPRPPAPPATVVARCEFDISQFNLASKKLELTIEVVSGRYQTSLRSVGKQEGDLFIGFEGEIWTESKGVGLFQLGFDNQTNVAFVTVNGANSVFKNFTGEVFAETETSSDYKYPVSAAALVGNCELK